MYIYLKKKKKRKERNHILKYKSFTGKKKSYQSKAKAIIMHTRNTSKTVHVVVGSHLFQSYPNQQCLNEVWLFNSDAKTKCSPREKNSETPLKEK